MASSPIFSAGSKPLSQQVGTLPQMDGALMDWLQPMTFKVVTKTTVNMQVVESFINVTMQAVRQPLSAQQLMMKPEGQRGWKWDRIHALPGQELSLDSEVIYLGIQYRVMGKWPWPEYGYIEYHLTQDYQDT